MFVNLLLTASSVVGGLFMGFLAGILSLFLLVVLFSFVREPLRLFVQFGTALFFIGPGLYYLAVVAFSDWVLGVSAAASFLWCLSALAMDREKR